MPSELVQEKADDFRVHTRAYTDPAIYDAEMQRIFEKTWVYVGHTSELQKPGDFKTANVGRNPVIVSHARDGKIHVLLNACRHRGNAVCRESRGSARSFRCPYHGWVYSDSGDLLAVTQPRGYPAGFAAELGGLQKLRTAVYRGLIFASMIDDVPSIEEHLGDARKYVDLWADLSPGAEFTLAHPHQYGYQGNWKFQAENAIDGWHARFVHESAFETIAEFGGPPPTSRSVRGSTRGFDNGIGILERPGIHQGLSPEQGQAYRQELLRLHSPERVDLIWNIRHIFLFPNLFLFDNLIRVIEPVACDRTNVTSYPLLLPGVSEELNRVRLMEGQTRLGTAGMVGLDDLEMFASNQTGMRSARMQWIVLSHGMAQDRPCEGTEWVGDDTSELPQRAIYRQWAKLMSAS
jgi:phenylpropionate dioxygenase-like ring-hydroxylating dioxygenase large terminal subunit